MMNKRDVVNAIVQALSHDLETLRKAVKTAHESATHAESKAENKYDTRGLEAAYLAHGQAQRAEQIAAAMKYYQGIPKQVLEGVCEQVALSSLVHVVDQDDVERWLWLGELEGGIHVNLAGRSIAVVTPQSPLGAALLGLEQGDTAQVRIAEKQCEYEVLSIL